MPCILPRRISPRAHHTTTAHPHPLLPAAALSFYFFERFRFFAERALGPSPLLTFLAGGLAQCVTVVIVYPVRSGKDLLQGQRKGQYKGLLDVWAQSYRAGGVGALYGGMGADLASVFVKRGLVFWSRDLFVAAFLAAFS